MRATRASSLPTISIAHCQRAVTYDRLRIEVLVAASLPLCASAAQRLGGPLSSLVHIEISVIGTRAMARVHREFLKIRGATDVITFPYGEVLVCAPVAAARAAEFHHSLTDEIALYIIHGLLHLAGHDDLLPADAARMAREQENVLQSAIRAEWH